MGKRQNDWARRKLKFFREFLGNRCAYCGISQETLQESSETLEFHCIIAGNPHHHGDGILRSTERRATFYAEQLRKGNLDLLCPSCHGKESQQQQIKYRNPPIYQKPLEE